MNPAKRQRVRKFTLENVIKKVTNIDSDDESLAVAREPLSHISSDDEVDEDNIIPEVSRCSVECLGSALDENSYNEFEPLFLRNIAPTTVDGVVYE